MLTLRLADLSYDQAEDRASHLRQRQNCLDWRESSRGDLPGLRNDLPSVERYEPAQTHASTKLTDIDFRKV